MLFHALECNLQWVYNVFQSVCYSIHIFHSNHLKNISWFYHGAKLHWFWIAAFRHMEVVLKIQIFLKSNLGKLGHCFLKFMLWETQVLFLKFKLGKSRLSLPEILAWRNSAAFSLNPCMEKLGYFFWNSGLEKLGYIFLKFRLGETRLLLPEIQARWKHGTIHW